jgi:integrase
MKGSISRLGDGRWLVRVEAGRHPATGKRIQPSRVVHGSRRRAEEALDVLRDEVRERPAGGPGTLEELVELWLSSPNRSGVARSGMSAYTTANRMRSYVLPALGSTPVHRITTADVTRMCDDLSRDRRLSPSTIRLTWGELRAMFNWAVKRRYVRSNPALGADVPSPRLKPPTTVGRDELCQNLAVLAEEDPELELVVLMAASFGLRRSELVGLTWSHIDLDSGLLRIRQGVTKVPGKPYEVTPTKTGFHGFADFPIHDALLVRLAARRTEFLGRLAALGCSHLSDRYVFSNDPTGRDPIHPDTLSGKLARHRAFHPELAGLTLQTLRRYAATDLHEQGDSQTVAAAVLRDTPETTARHYLALDRQRARRAVIGIVDRIEESRNPAIGPVDPPPASPLKGAGTRTASTRHRHLAGRRRREPRRTHGTA